jgi:hypothetical protein
MTQPEERTMGELLAEAAASLPEPFSRSTLIDWISMRRPDVEQSSISTHIRYATRRYAQPDRHPLVFARRFSSGPAAPAAPSLPRVPAGTPAPAPEAPALPSSDRVLLVGCSHKKASAAAPARELFRGETFRRARAHSMASGRPWYVLSAEFGLGHHVPAGVDLRRAGRGSASG